MQNINNLRIQAFKDISSPAEVMKKAPISEKASATVFKAREDIQAILEGRDNRKIIIVGPCSIHDYDLALDYAEKLNKLRERVEDKMVLVMRAYFEKPRTTVGWKGFIYDPYLDDSYSLVKGVEVARDLLVKINDMGLPTGTEVLGPIVIQYYSDLICWSAIGARTTESQTHRELASGLSMPVGFKNGTEGNVDIAVNAIVSADSRHHFLGMDNNGKVSVVETKGNQHGHIILRGGKNGPNYKSESVSEVESYCEQEGREARMLIDCSHANSSKDHNKQELVWNDVWRQINNGSKSVCGLMVESNINPGKQSIGGGFGELEYGVSVTDACIGWGKTEELIMDAYKRFKFDKA
jgi:3-deoxy-7-phosphoheptulonate synthase